jgi:hypothetical protein
MVFNTQHTSMKDWQRKDKGTAGLRSSTIRTISPIGQLRQPSGVRQNNQQKTVTTQEPRSQFLQILSVGNPRGKNLQE